MILPIELIGKTIKDCYNSKEDGLFIEFEDGLKIRIHEMIHEPEMTHDLEPMVSFIEIDKEP